MQLFELLNPEDVCLNITPDGKENIIRQMVAHLAKTHSIQDCASLQNQVLEREALGTTGIGRGLAVPHVKTDLVSGIFGCLAYFPQGIDFKSLDGEKAKVVFLVVSSPDQADEYLSIMSQATRVLKDSQNQRVIFSPTDNQAILDVLAKVCRK